MGIRSDVAIAIKNEAFEVLSVRSQMMVREHFEEAAEIHDEGMLFHCKDIKWYTGTDPDLIRLYSELNELNDEDFLILQACHDYPETTDGDLGGWIDNPWEVYRDVRVSIDWCA